MTTLTSQWMYWLTHQHQQRPFPWMHSLQAIACATCTLFIVTVTTGLHAMERLPFRSSNDILGMEGVACVLKRDAKIFGVGVVEKGV